LAEALSFFGFGRGIKDKILCLWEKFKMKDVEIMSEEGWMVITRASEQQMSRQVKTIEDDIHKRKENRRKKSDEKTDNKQSILL